MTLLSSTEQRVLDTVCDRQLERADVAVRIDHVAHTLRNDIARESVEAATESLADKSLLKRDGKVVFATARGFVASRHRQEVEAFLVAWLSFFKRRLDAVGVADFHSYPWLELLAALRVGESPTDAVYRHAVITMLAFDILGDRSGFASRPDKHTELMVPSDPLDLYDAKGIDDLLSRVDRRGDHGPWVTPAARVERASPVEARESQPTAPAPVIVNQYFQNSTIGAVSAGSSAVSHGTVDVHSLGDTPALTPTPATTAISADLRARDLAALRAFWCDFPTDEIDNFLERAAFRQVPGSIFYWYDRIAFRAQSSEFYVYDDETRAALEAFVRPFLRTIANDDFFTEMSGGLYRFISEAHYHDHGEWEAELREFRASVRAARLGYGQLIGLMRRKWAEIDLVETSREARARRRREAVDLEPDVQLADVELAQQGRATNRQPPAVDVTTAVDALLKRATAVAKVWLADAFEQQVTLKLETASEHIAANVLVSQGRAQIDGDSCTITVRRP